MEKRIQNKNNNNNDNVIIKKDIDISVKWE